MPNQDFTKKLSGIPPWPGVSHKPRSIAMSPFSRRLFLGAAAASAVVSPSVASTSADPIFAAIAAHRKFWRSLDAVLERRSALERALPRELRRTNLAYDDHSIVETDSPEWIAVEKALDAVYAADSNAELDLASIVPTTSAGVVALLSYADEFAALGNTWPNDLIDDNGKDATWESLVMRNCAAALAQRG